MVAIPDPSNCPDHPQFNAFVETIRILRAPGGCAWDQEQTHTSIKKHVIEEAYEVVDAIERNNLEDMKEELGDLLEQIVLQSQIAADADEFTIDDVCQTVNEKMIRRHPHVFGEDKAYTEEEVLALWEQVKLQELKLKEEKLKARGVEREGLLDSVPKSLPALMQCQKLSKKAAAAGFEWDTTDQVWEKVAEEIQEFKEAPRKSREALVEFGDILFALVNVARKEGIDAESALRASNQKFIDRWESMEQEKWDQGQELYGLSVEELEELWQNAKKKEKN